MSRTRALSLIESGSTTVELKELSGLVISNISKGSLASGLKSQAYTGNPAVGSVEYRRFVNAQSKVYGTARAATRGEAITAPPVVVNLDQHREIVEEVAKFDLDTFGVGSVLARRADAHIEAVDAELDEAFFAAAVTEGVSYEPASTLTTPAAILENFIQTLEEVKNDYVRGVPRRLMRLVCSPSYYGTIRDLLDSRSNANVDTASEEFGTYHGVRVYSSVYLPAGIDAVLMVDGAMAQPALIYPYAEPEKIPLSNDFGVSLFYDYGTKVLAPDLIFFYESGAGALGTLTVTSVDSTVAGKTKITVQEAPQLGRSFVYATDASTAPAVTYNADLSDWTALPADGLIAATNGHKITVAEIDNDDKLAKKAGNTTIVVE